MRRATRNVTGPGAAVSRGGAAYHDFIRSKCVRPPLEEPAALSTFTTCGMMRSSDRDEGELSQSTQKELRHAGSNYCRCVGFNSRNFDPRSNDAGGDSFCPRA